MAQLVKKLGIKREKGWLHFLRGTEVWRIPMRRTGGPAAPKKAEFVADGDFDRDDERYIYFIDSSGDIKKASRHYPPPYPPEPKLKCDNGDFEIPKWAKKKRRRQTKSLPLPG